MQAKKRKSSAARLRPVSVDCPFCRGKTDPDYKNPSELTKYMTDRAKIIPKVRNGLCAKHQRRLSVAIKRARHLAFLPFTGGL